MSEGYDVLVKVVSQQGHCATGHRVGDEWVIGDTTPEGICLSAFDSLLSNVRVMQFGGSFPWENNPEAATIACPDAENPVVFEIRRLRK